MATTTEDGPAQDDAPEITPNEGQPKAAPAGVGDVIAYIEEYTGKLVPPKDVTVEDITGCEHAIHGHLPGAVEQQVFRLLRQIEGDQVSEVMAAWREVATQDRRDSTTLDMGQRIVDALLSLCASDAVLRTIEGAFVLAHPAAFGAAVNNARENKLTRQYLPADGVDPRPSHVFSLTEIVWGVVPFVLGASNRTGRRVSEMKRAAM